MAKAPDIQVFTAPTMKGGKPLIFLEEAGVGYELAPVSFAHREQKSAWYMALNPVGQIPTIVDRGNGNVVVFQSGAIPWYLAEKFDCFLPKDARGRIQAFEWLMFQMSSIGPMMGQAMYFSRRSRSIGSDESEWTRRRATARRRDRQGRLRNRPGTWT